MFRFILTMKYMLLFGIFVECIAIPVSNDTSYHPTDYGNYKGKLVLSGSPEIDSKPNYAIDHKPCNDILCADGRCVLYSWFCNATDKKMGDLLESTFPVSNGTSYQTRHIRHYRRKVDFQEPTELDSTFHYKIVYKRCDNILCADGRCVLYPWLCNATYKKTGDLLESTFPVSKGTSYQPRHIGHYRRKVDFQEPKEPDSTFYYKIVYKPCDNVLCPDGRCVLYSWLCNATDKRMEDLLESTFPVSNGTSYQPRHIGHYRRKVDFLEPKEPESTFYYKIVYKPCDNVLCADGRCVLYHSLCSNTGVDEDLSTSKSENSNLWKKQSALFHCVMGALGAILTVIVVLVCIFFIEDEECIAENRTYRRLEKHKDRVNVYYNSKLGSAFSYPYKKSSPKENFQALQMVETHPERKIIDFDEEC